MAVYDVDINGLRVSAAIWHADGDPVWVSVRPNLRRIHVLAGDILETLGRTRDVSGKGRNESEDVQLAAAWLGAHRTTALVLVDAQRLHHAFCTASPNLPPQRMSTSGSFTGLR